VRHRTERPELSAYKGDMAKVLYSRKQPQDAVRWRFVQGADSQWRWHRGANGDSPAVSSPFADFGRCVSDAIKNGFKADMHSYATQTPAMSIDWTKRPPW
jgi:hypothetical protein